MHNRNMWVGSLILAILTIGAAALLAQDEHGGRGHKQEKHGHVDAAHASKAGASKAHMKHMKHVAKLKQLLADAKAAADAGDSKKAAAIIAEAQGLIEKMSIGGVVNSRCPIMGSKIDPAKVPANLTRSFHGKKVGFCCAGCPAQWDKLSDAAKAKKLHAVMSD